MVRLFINVILLLGFGLVSNGAAQEPEQIGATTVFQASQVNVNSLVNEIQKMSEKTDQASFVWWMPEEFWRVTNEGSGQTEEQLEELLAMLRPYTLIAVVDGTIGPFGGITYVPEPTLRTSVWLVDGAGDTYRPLPEEQIDPDTRNLIAVFRPLLANMLGEMGEHMVFVAFPATDGQGHRIAEATKEGRFSVRVGQEEFEWRLPLGSLVPQKICPVDGELLGGAWKFCPWHGAELLDVEVETDPLVRESPASEPQKACDGGDGDSCFDLGTMYASGVGVTQDLNRAASLYQKACDGGYAAGCYKLGVLYATGEGVTKDLARATSLLKKACDGGVTLACR
jgi:hypothetical protein